MIYKIFELEVNFGLLCQSPSSIPRVAIYIVMLEMIAAGWKELIRPDNVLKFNLIRKF